LEKVLEHYGIDTYGHIDGEVMILCPSHSEDRPSCSANLDKNVLHCHACGFKGGVIRLIMWKEGFDDFKTAVEFTAETFGEGYGSVPEPTRLSRAGLSRGQGFKPRYRNSALRGRKVTPERP
jgi:hypothetical protein